MQTGKVLTDASGFSSIFLKSDINSTEVTNWPPIIAMAYISLISQYVAFVIASKSHSVMLPSMSLELTTHRAFADEEDVPQQLMRYTHVRCYR